MNDYMLEIRHVDHCYKNKVHAVSGLDLLVKKGEVYGFLGPNGAGKSTTIKLLSGILFLQSGDILVAGTSIRTDPVGAKRHIGYVPDEPCFYKSYRGIDHLNFVSDIFGVESERRRSLIERYARLFDIENALKDRISSYSHGMKQKLAITAALVHEPDLLVLDEPLVGLDPKASRDVKDIMRHLAEEGRSVFFSTHVLDVAEDVCDTVGIIDHGTLIASGSPSDLRGDSSLEDFFLRITEA